MQKPQNPKEKVKESKISDPLSEYGLAAEKQIKLRIEVSGDEKLRS